MDKQSLARRYRPVTLDDYVGNSELKDTVRRYLQQGRPQSIMLTGHTGCGKTTIARLIVKEYLCDDWDAERKACDKCFQCEAVNEYIRTGSTEMLPDVTEIDITDKSGKKDIDSLLESVEYPSISGGWKVYICDEVHAATIQAQNRMLKVLEEPPEKVLFIFCTTDPQKVIDTLKNRCQLKLQVRKPNMSELVKHLKNICLNEGKDYDVEGLRTIASRSEFVVRDSLNNLERVFETRGNAVSDSVNEEFHEVSETLLFSFFRAFKEKNFYEYVSLLYKIKVSFDFNQFLTSLTNFTVRGIYILNGVEVEGLSAEEVSSYSKLFKEFTSAEISYILSSLKKMNLGDVEANLMAFVYFDMNKSYDSDEVLLSARSSETSEKVESNFRNQVLAKKESDKLKNGISSVSSLTREVGVEDMLSMFHVEKVK